VTKIESSRQNVDRYERRVFVVILTIAVLIVSAVVAVVYGPAYIAYRNYTPQDGDIVFQSLPHSRLVNAIEGVSGSPFSHCGLVARRAGVWVVYEAYDGVEVTPLKEFIFRGRKHGFAVYRLKPRYQPYVPKIIERTTGYLGRPYDSRYRMDDENIYCSELIYKAFRDATGGEQLGAFVRFGDLPWQPYENTIRYYEGGPVPIDRQMITPKDLAAADQLDMLIAYNIAAERP